MRKFIQKAFATDALEYRHIGVLDGIRALSVVLVVGFHFWQQSWLWNLYDPSKLKAIGIEDAGMNWLFETGYVWVDMMILLTGLCLFLPHAARMVYGDTPLSSVPKFYAKRAARIFPSYYFNILVMLIFFVRPQNYGGTAGFLKDLFSHLTFTHMLSKETYLYTHFNGVLWTVAVEMLFYLLFPLIAWLFRKAPFLTYLGMNAASLGYYLFVTRLHADDLSFYINRFPSFLCVFANGMLAALVIVSLSRNMTQNRYTGLGFTALAVFGLFLMRLIIKYGLAKAGSSGQLWQIQNRFMLTFVFAIFIVGACFSFRWFRVIFSNPVAKFFAAISYNLYIWHQLVAIYFKQWKIPHWVSADNLPQRDAGTAWQWKYTIIIWLVSLGVAAAVTYLLEKPIHRLILRAIDKKGTGKKVRAGS
ncbi:MAG: acyltransferase [Clostridia bacterium]|nr:acyltransferase [Clostridia bacterium]